ncbi:hypothetical protein O0I10_007652 [Lichtheimia ornata]|uniref:Mitochondrial zinc maintenance protein 1, mitochondrial n=1 Tax=Lichtheimia ornata TaxID=688661 RepID=A0AAD7V0G5_9FUNG|nr:uncharacterized protein O0I10_007652 [Lichtheimia ornata]KAJ8656575.1 hypothetical protein O0I10_007652 [Lichtheimia ornata]
MSSAASPSRQAAIAAYRNLLRTQRQVFGEDIRAIQAAKKETHSRFMQYKDESNVDVLEEKLKLADQVIMLLRHNVVQGIPKDDNTFELRITKDTELGDNESIKLAKGSHRRNRKKAAVQGCCGSK